MKIYQDPEFVQRTLTNAGLELALNTPSEFSRFLEEDRQKTAVLAKRAGVEPQ